MMKQPEIAIISAAVRAYMESEGGIVLPRGDARLKAVVATAVAAYMDTENAAV